jgi:hypothetical protein
MGGKDGRGNTEVSLMGPTEGLAGWPAVEDTEAAAPCAAQPPTGTEIGELEGVWKVPLELPMWIRTDVVAGPLDRKFALLFAVLRRLLDCESTAGAKGE